MEVWGNIESIDKVQEGVTRQLDYYKYMYVTHSSYANATKKYNGNNSDWWLRCTYPYYGYNFYVARSEGRSDYFSYSDSNGVAPAFRLGE